MTHLLALAATRWRLRVGLLAIVFPVAGIHIVFDVSCVGQNVGHHSLFDGPTEEVELANGGLLNGLLTADLKADALTTAERIEESLGIRLEFAFVVKVHQKLTGWRVRSFDQRIGDVELFGIVGHKPVNQTQTHGRRAY